MSLSNLAGAALLGLSGLLGVATEPADVLGPAWDVDRAFAASDGAWTLEARTAAIPEACRARPDAWVRFPAVVHGAQSLHDGDRTLLRFGDPTFATTRSFYGAPAVECRRLAEVRELRWVVVSPTRYFARLASAPELVPDEPADGFWRETLNAVAGGALLLMAVLNALVFSGKVSRALSTSLTVSNLALAAYFVLASAGAFGLPIPMLAAHKLADTGVWVGLFFTFACLHLQGAIGRGALVAYGLNVVPALALVAVGADGDVVQLGTSLPFGLTIALLLFAFFGFLRRIPRATRKLSPVGQALGLGLFAFTAINDMFAVLGLTDAPMLLAVGVVGAQLFTAIAVNDSIHATYQERDYLRKNLEREVERQTVELRAKGEALRVAHEKAERLLLNVLPPSIAERLKEEHRAIADGFESVTVLFADVCDFTPLSARMPPGELVAFLNGLFSEFDGLAARHGLEKIKTIGDAYMVAGGLPERRDDHALAVARMALAMREVAARLRTPDGRPLQLRIGVNTGPVVAGVIGQRKFIYDLWGDTVNLASRMESHGLPGRVQIAASTREALGARAIVEARGPVDVKGKGRVETFFLEGLVEDAEEVLAAATAEARSGVGGEARLGVAARSGADPAARTDGAALA